VYRSALAPLTWWVWVAFAAANLIDIAVQGRDRLSVTAAAALLLVTAVAYVAALRPRVIADPGGIIVRNPLRDHRLPWPSVQRVDLGTLLRVRCSWQEAPGKGRGQQDAPCPETAERTRVFHAWALQSSPRPSSVTGLRPAFGRDDLARRSAGGYGRPPDPPGLAHRKETERIARALDERARADRGQAPPAANPGSAARPMSAWHWPSVVALLLTAALLTAAILA
jgi:Bacterial PH domain